MSVGIDVDATVKLLLSLSAAAASVTAVLVKSYRYAAKRVEEYRGIEAQKVFKLDTVAHTVASIVPVLTDIQRELKANGGGSLRDIITEMRNDHAVERTARRLVHNIASFEVTIREGEEVKVSFVSAAYVALTGLTKDDCEDMGWVRAVAPEDRDRVSMLAGHARRDVVVIATSYTAMNVLSGVRTLVDHTGTPVFNYAGVMVGWVVVLRPHSVARGRRDDTE